MYATTVREPAEGCHTFVAEGEDDLSCAVCGEGPWRSEHAYRDRHADIPEGTDLSGWYAVEADDGSGYTPSGLRWKTAEEARSWGSGLALRWFGCTNIRTRRCDAAGEPVGDTVDQVL